ncbi:hypothetical protein L226DRAFT_576384 [Lentinus tigrinus ALCF2SS1-7]|uniref:Uncharacterized protein n=1 Tax=Lentinus tigrinus ALCF2SS1-6 TaxID=1328759 RepID=A0A5C2RS33_9APHY|nr:hypothetical protein L227DRAFT_617072 [Lentinus tigrinus ALCF2SS1-6]RPD68505.1 hypothetical protein L226DRAFT_576384 [Lentinus tigrinus ALCF2SS1-7]
MSANGSETPLSVTIGYGPSAVIAVKPILPTKCKAVGTTSGQQSLSIVWTREKQDAIDADLSSFFRLAETQAATMAEKYGNKPDYYLRLMFSGGMTMQRAREPSAFNAWAHNLAKEVNEDADTGDALNLLDLQREHLDEYHKLSAAEKKELVESFKEERNSRKMGTRVNLRGRQADANNTFNKIEDMIIGLKCRVGIDGFYCFFKNNSEFQMRPRWFFTSPQLNHYLMGQIKWWDVEAIGALSEAFSITGCDLMSYLCNARARSDWVKTEIRDKITAALIKITENQKAIMHYKSYEKDIVLNYGIELVGWPDSLRFACPSDLPTTLEPLQNLLQAIDNGKCYFCRLSKSERAQRRGAHQQKVAEGSVLTRQPRSDNGKKCAPYQRHKQVDPEADQEEGGTDAPPRKWRRHRDHDNNEEYSR